MSNPMTLTLFDFNYHVLPGDVLLLRSTGLRAVANQTGQRALRAMRPLRTAKFTHVALVINNTHIADAMPGAGVRIRRWRDSAPAYNLERCMVARHPGLLSLADNPARLLAGVQRYYSQRYALKSLSRRSAKHNAGIVCSQFVALVLHGLGVPSFVHTAMRALPSDIDHRTRGVNGWRQFPLTVYGLHPAVSRPPVGDPYWTVLAASLPRRVAQAFPDVSVGTTTRQPSDTTARVERQAATSEQRGSTAIDRMMNPTRNVSDVTTLVSEAVGALMASSMDATEAVLRITAELDRLVLAVTSTLAGGQDPAQRERMVALSLALLDAMSGEGPQPRLSGQILLDQWHVYYVNAVNGAPRVLADDDAPQRLTQHRVQLGVAIGELTRLATEWNDEASVFKERWDNFCNFVRQGCPMTEELVAQLHQHGSLLINGVHWLDADTADVILARTRSYAPLVEDTLLPLIPALGSEVAEQAMGQVQALMALDEQRLRWVLESKPTLQALINALASLLAAPAD
ncbi:hypothetical protein [Caballeronia sp.]|uniref:hypothetical protein n=1 Tax=Caballeronia sp. TaxID=1931223 RepID=UPI003C4E31EC